MRKQSWIGIGLLVVGFAAGLLLGMNIVSERAALDLRSGAGSGERSETASVMLDFGDGTVKIFDAVAFAEGENLFDVLKRVAESKNLGFNFQEYAGLGKLVSEIDGRKNGVDDRYWQYWVNNRHPEVGADQYLLRPGDVVEWKFINFQSE